jgi:hypothetical protein
MKRLIHYLFHRPKWHKLPMIPRQFAVEFDPATVDADTQTLMRLTQIRSPQGVELLRKRWKAKDARALIDMLPSRKRRRRVGARLMGVIRTMAGTTPYDPMKSISRQHAKRRR